jgi:hypothetical protein
MIPMEKTAVGRDSVLSFRTIFRLQSLFGWVPDIEEHLKFSIEPEFCI